MRPRGPRKKKKKRKELSSDRGAAKGPKSGAPQVEYERRAGGRIKSKHLVCEGPDGGKRRFDEKELGGGCPSVNGKERRKRKGDFSSLGKEKGPKTSVQKLWGRRKKPNVATPREIRFLPPKCKKSKKRQGQRNTSNKLGRPNHGSDRRRGSDFQ